MTEDTESQAPDAPAKGGIVKLGVAVVLLMTVEAAVLLFFAGGAPAEAGDPEVEATKAIAEGDQADAPRSDLVEVALTPPYSVTNSSADLGTLVHVNFELVCAVSGKNKDAFTNAAEVEYHNRLRQVVTEIVRSASLEELQDPDMDRLKRQIREKINKTLQHSYVVDVIVPKFQVHVQ